MSEMGIELHWTRSEPELKPRAYSAEHRVDFNAANALTVDTAPDYGGDLANTNPEQALTSALASCHMMTFLALCAKARWPVASYRDTAHAQMGKNPKGQMSVTRIDLTPVVTFDDGFTVTPEKMAEMQDRAHRYCFIANTLADSVEIVVNTP